MNYRVLGAFAAVWGVLVIILRFLGDSDASLGEPQTFGDVGVLIFGWALLGVGLYLLVRRSKSSRDP